LRRQRWPLDFVYFFNEAFGSRRFQFTSDSAMFARACHG